MTIEQKLAMVRFILSELAIARVHLAQAAERVAGIAEVANAHGYSDATFPVINALRGIEIHRDVLIAAHDAITKEHHAQLFPELHARMNAEHRARLAEAEARDAEALAA